MRKQQTREKILEAAREIFSEKGYHGTTVSDIIGKVGMAQGSFYNYFENKRSIFMELLEDFISKVEQAASSFHVNDVKDRNTYTVMAVSIAAAIGYVFQENEKLARIFFHEAMGIDEEINEIIDRAYRSLVATSLKFIRRGQEIGVIRKDIPAEIMAGANVGMGTFLVNRYLRGEYNEFRPEQLIITPVSIQLDGFLQENLDNKKDHENVQQPS
ncbi:MAG: TetR/AcrR family transcriptional regulator [Candidatus Hydrogenedentota bacterium]|nr:MAG: TetR/AcrR family transcriptional regulator [Candidatus Hydrogenedentota bacterium]